MSKSPAGVSTGTKKVYRLGTRASELATTQSNYVAELLRRQGLSVELVTVKTQGDVTSGSLAKFGGTGLFAAALRQALQRGECDLAVHSYKDLPTAPWPELTIAACPPREDTADALCAREGMGWEELPTGARIGTGSPRRVAQLKYLRPDLRCVDIRGNVGTRLGRVKGLLAEGGQDLDGVILAAAGLNRLGRGDVISHRFSDTQMLPAPAQGALAVEVRSADLGTDSVLQAALGAINDADCLFSARAEQAVLEYLEAGCAAPVGALCQPEAGGYTLRAVALSTDGQQRCFTQVEVSHTDLGSAADLARRLEAARELGFSTAQKLLEQGAAQITDLQATKDRGSDTHDESALWAPGVSGAVDPAAHISAYRSETHP